MSDDYTVIGDPPTLDARLFPDMTYTTLITGQSWFSDGEGWIPCTTPAGDSQETWNGTP